MPLGHCEGPDLRERLDRSIELAGAIVEEAPDHLKSIYEASAQQPVLVREVVAAFGRHPHRNQVLGRDSTGEEAAYIERGEFPHSREIPEF